MNPRVGGTPDMLKAAIAAVAPRTGIALPSPEIVRTSRVPVE